MNSAAKHSCLLFLSVMVGSAAQSWQKPPKAVLDALNAPTTPTLAISPTRTHALQGQAVRYPPMSEVSQPMLRLAGQRINPKTNGLHNTTFNSSLTLRKLPEGTEIKIDMPAGAKLSGGRWCGGFGGGGGGNVQWTPDSKGLLVFTVKAARGAAPAAPAAPTGPNVQE